MSGQYQPPNSIRRSAVPEQTSKARTAPATETIAAVAPRCVNSGSVIPVRTRPGATVFTRTSGASERAATCVFPSDAIVASLAPRTLLFSEHPIAFEDDVEGFAPLARESFERSIELDPSHVKSLLNLTRVLLELNEPREASERVFAALALDSTSAETYRLVGRVQTALGETDAAIDSYRAALALDSHDAWAMNNMGLLLIQLGRFEEALRPLARAVQQRLKVLAQRQGLWKRVHPHLMRHSCASHLLESSGNLRAAARKKRSSASSRLMAIRSRMLATQSGRAD